MSEQTKSAWEQRPAPPSLQFVQRFVNTHEYSALPDHLATVESTRRWLRSQGFASADLDPQRVRDLAKLRDGIREVLLAHAGHPDLADSEAAARRLNTMLRTATVHLMFDDAGEAATTVRGAGLERFTNTIAAQILTASLDGSWPRLKACGNDECLVAFYDHSRNGTARYCSTAICANRVRQRSFRQRAEQREVD